MGWLQITQLSSASAEEPRGVAGDERLGHAGVGHLAYGIGLSDEVHEDHGRGAFDERAFSEPVERVGRP